MRSRSLTGHGRTNQCNIRLTDNERTLLELSAAASGYETITEFIVCTALARALRVTTRRGMSSRDRKNTIPKEIAEDVRLHVAFMAEEAGEKNPTAWVRRLGLIGGHESDETKTFDGLLEREAM